MVGEKGERGGERGEGRGGGGQLGRWEWWWWWWWCDSDLISRQLGRPPPHHRTTQRTSSSSSSRTSKDLSPCSWPFSALCSTSVGWGALSDSDPLFSYMLTECNGGIYPPPSQLYVETAGYGFKLPDNNAREDDVWGGELGFR